MFFTKQKKKILKLLLYYTVFNEMCILWFMKSPTTGWHACKVKKHFHCLIICIYFYLICSNDSRPLRDANRWWLVQLVNLISISLCLWCLIKQCLWVQCCFVYSVTGETAIFTQKQHLVAKNEFVFSFRQCENQVSQFCQQVGWQYAKVSCWHQDETAWDSFKK